MDKSLPISVQAALRRFDRARTTLEAFREEHPEIVKQYLMLIEEAESARENVKSEFRKHYDTIGPRLDKFSATQKWRLDPHALILALGASAAEPYLKTTVEVDRDTFTAAVEDGEISADVVEKVELPNGLTIRGPKIS